MPKEAADAVWALARENGWYREGEGAERYRMARIGAGKSPSNKAALNLVVAWHGEPLGNLTHDRFEWRWKPARNSGLSVVRETKPGKLPAFVESLLPEGWLAQVLHVRDDRETLKRGRRYMSNVTIVEARDQVAALPSDVLTTKLDEFGEAGQFIGRY